MKKEEEVMPCIRSSTFSASANKKEDTDTTSLHNSRTVNYQIMEEIEHVLYYYRPIHGVLFAVLLGVLFIVLLERTGKRTQKDTKV